MFIESHRGAKSAGSFSSTYALSSERERSLPWISPPATRSTARLPSLLSSSSLEADSEGEDDGDITAKGAGFRPRARPRNARGPRRDMDATRKKVRSDG